MSFFGELKRRNVFKVGVSYIVTAWILLQVVDIVLENITAPDWIMQVFMLALVIGFPLALIFAWAFELTSEGIKLEKDVDKSQSITHVTGQRLNRNIMIALAVAVVLLLVDKVWQSSGSGPSPVADTTETVIATPPASEPEEVSIAVLPFVDMSPEGDQAYFADGISEEILNVLVKTHSLKVAGRTSSFQFRGRNEDLRTIGEALGVKNILEGSIRKASNRVRITAQLVTAEDGFHLWSETYDRELTDIFAIQDEIARSITDALAIELNLADSGQSLVTVSTENMEAYDRYLEARGLIVQRLDFPRAIQLLDEATHLDPQFAKGWAANAQAHSLMKYYMDVNAGEIGAKAESMALQALELDPDLSTAHSVLGDVYRDRYDWKKAAASYQRALALNPDDVEANSQYAQMLWRAMYFDQAVVHSARAVELDPLSWLNLTVHAILLDASGEQAAGWAAMEHVLDMTGRSRDYPLRFAIITSISDGRIDRAIELVNDLINSKPEASGVRTYYEEMLPSLDSGQGTLAFLRANFDRAFTFGISSPWMLNLYWAAYYGDYEMAEEIMQRGSRLDEEQGTLDTGWYNHPVINPLRNTETYKALIRRTGLDDYWRETGFPLNCRPIGADDFACN